MATVQKYRDWVKANADQLLYMVDNGYITEDDVKAMNNVGGKYSEDQQTSAFKKIAEDVAWRYSEDRLKDAGDALTESEVKSLRKFRDGLGGLYEKDNLLSTKLREQIQKAFPDYKKNNALNGIVESTRGMNDQDLREYIFTGRQFFKQQPGLSDAVLNQVPDLKDYLTVKPDFGVKKTEKDFQKMFHEPNILDKLNEYSLADIDYVARKNGMDGKTLLNEMSQAKVEKDRNRIAHGGEAKDMLDLEKYRGFRNNPIADNIGGAALSLFGPRQQEAIARGESPSTRDYVGDIGENIIYSIPAAGLLKAPSLAARAGAATVGASGVPLLSELYDSVFYDEEYNPRSEFSGRDVFTGSMINLLAPQALKRSASGLARKTGLNGVAKTIEEFGTREAPNNRVAAELLESKGKNIEEKAQNYIRSLGKDPATYRVGTNGLEKTPKLWSKMSTEETPHVTSALKDIFEDFKPSKSKRVMAEQEAMENYLTNKFGDNYVDQDAYKNIPFFGQKLYEAFEEDRKSKEEQRKEDKAKEQADKRRRDFNRIWDFDL